MSLAVVGTKKNVEGYFCAVTPPGRAAIATTVVWGCGDWEWLDHCWQSRTPSDRRRVGGIYYGLWKGTLSESETQSAEDVVLTWDTPHQVSIHSHGGWVSQNLIVADLERVGLSKISPPDFFRARGENFWDAQLARTLIEAPTEVTAGRLQDQQACWNSWREDRLDEVRKQDRESLSLAIQRTLSTVESGRRYTQPWSIVLAGPPNAGKSSLLNALVGFNRVLVSPLPGTTRDVIHQITALDGWPISLTDTAGVRTTDQPLELAGIQAAGLAAANCDCLVWVVDGSLPADSVPIADLAPRPPNLIVCNKVDALHPSHRGTYDCLVSARTGERLPELLTTLGQSLARHLPPADEAVIFAAPLAQRLRDLQDAVAQNDFAEATKLLES